MNLFTKIDAVLDGLPYGWCSKKKAKTLAAAVLAIRPNVAVEIGTYAGRSFFPIAMAMQELNHGIAWGIDPYSEEIAADGEGPETKEWWQNSQLGKIEHAFHNVLKVLELEKFTNIIKAPSETIAPPQHIGLLHIDGQHFERAIDDATRFGMNVEIGGLCCLDDITWTSGHVQKAAERLVAMGFQELYRETTKDGDYVEQGLTDNWAMFQRIEFA